MRSQRFSIVVEQPFDEVARDALAERCRDATVTGIPHQRGVVISFERDAPTLIDGVVTAVRDLDAVGLRAASVRDDGLVTTDTVAERVGRSPEAVRLWVVGRTGAGSFPEPAETRSGTAYYRWSEVVTWLRDRMGVDAADPDPALAAVNLALQLRELAPRVSRMAAIRALIAG
ncbi:hypothetical protein HC031_18390 [Planosporangium thailandense]|uniref:DNA-binding protein n=1 Tax=Planosporangium thailandense TaxID=765197 RepID=A0ABX0Y2V5_9ACTN|nr:hypothetical protein [Planosporangium thailandense]NJC71674.1 hypothetical protein [Planosporangium thailandense]